MNRRFMLFSVICFAWSFTAVVRAQSPVADSPAIEHRIDTMLQKLTVAEKIQLIGGTDSMYTFAAPSIGLP